MSFMRSTWSSPTKHQDQGKREGSFELFLPLIQLFLSWLLDITPTFFLYDAWRIAGQVPLFSDGAKGPCPAGRVSQWWQGGLFDEGCQQTSPHIWTYDMNCVWDSHLCNFDVETHYFLLLSPVARLLKRGGRTFKNSWTKYTLRGILWRRLPTDGKF